MRTTLIRQPLVSFVFLPIPNWPHARQVTFLCVVHSSSLTISHLLNRKVQRCLMDKDRAVVRVIRGWSETLMWTTRCLARHAQFWGRRQPKYRPTRRLVSRRPPNYCCPRSFSTTRYYCRFIYRTTRDSQHAPLRTGNFAGAKFYYAPAVAEICGEKIREKMLEFSSIGGNFWFQVPGQNSKVPTLHRPSLNPVRLHRPPMTIMPWGWLLKLNGLREWSKQTS